MHAGNQNPLFPRKLRPAFGAVGFPASLRATVDKGARIPGIMQDTQRLAVFERSPEQFSLSRAFLQSPRK